MNHQLPLNYNYFCPYRPYPYPMFIQQEPHYHEQSATQSTYKAEVTEWLQSLPEEELKRIFQINGQEKTFPILKMYIYDHIFNPSLYALKQNTALKLESRIEDLFYCKTIPQSSLQHSQSKAAEELYDKLIVTDDKNFMDQITLSMLPPLPDFLALLEDLSEKQLFVYQPKVNQEPIWFTAHSFQSCAKWIVREFEKNVAYYYIQQRDRKKKCKPQISATNNEYNYTELKDFYKHFATKEKLAAYYELFIQDISAHPTLLENTFYSQIFESAVLKLRMLNDTQQAFISKCLTDPNIIYSMLYTKMSELYDHKTYFLKRCYRILDQEYKKFLEGELIKDEDQKEKPKAKQPKKARSKNKTKKKLCQSQTQTKGLDPVELTKRLSSKNLQESNLKSPKFFPRSFSQNNLFKNDTPPNTPSEIEFSDEACEQSTLCPSYHSPVVEIELVTIKQARQIALKDYQNKFLPNTPEENLELAVISGTIAKSILSKAQQQYTEEVTHNLELLKQQRKLRKKQKCSEKRKNGDEHSLTSPNSEMTFQSHESNQHSAQLTACTASTSEEEYFFQRNGFLKQGCNGRKQQFNRVRGQKPQVQVSCQRKPLNEVKLERSSTQHIEVIQAQENEHKGEAQAGSRAVKSYSPISEEGQEITGQNCEALNKEQEGEERLGSAVGNSASCQAQKMESQQRNKKKKKKEVANQKPGVQSQQESKPELSQMELEVEAQSLMYEQLTSNIQEFTDEILRDYNEMLKFRMLAFNRIQELVLQTFQCPLIQIRLFGSCATGLALLDSDIDIGIIGFELLSKVQLQTPFEVLRVALAKRTWVKNIKPIFKSHIPVIKFEIDPLVAFDVYEHAPQLDMDDSLRKQWVEMKRRLHTDIKIDITFNSFCYQFNDHLGYVSTEMVQKWIGEYPNMQHILLVLKTVIKKIGLSDAYSGGLSSFSLIILVYSYLLEGKSKGKGIGETFLSLLNFYGSEFDRKEIGIGVYSANKETLYFRQKDYPLAELPIVIFSPINQRLLSHGCQHIEKIFETFRAIVARSQPLKEFYVEYLKMGKKKRQRQKRHLENFIAQEISQLK